MSEPVAWMFKNPDGSVRFILDDPARVKAWRSAHTGEIIPLYEKVSETQDAPKGQ